MRSVLCPTVVGRDEELDTLFSAWEQVRNGHGSVVAIVGEAGIGKSRLVRELVGSVDAAVFAGRAVEGEAFVAYQPLAEALLSGLRNREPLDVPEIAPFRSALARLLPHFSEPQHISTDPPAILVSEGLIRLFRAAGDERGTLLVLEDLHWADFETLAVVDHVAGHLATEPVLLIATLRREPGSPAMALVRSLVAKRMATMIEVDRLGCASVEEMARRCLAVDDLPGMLGPLLDRAEGVPFLVEELLAGVVTAGSLVHDEGSWTVREPLVASVPVTFAETVHRRLTLLGGLVPEVLRGAAVLGRQFDWRLLPDVTGLDAAAVGTALRQAADVQLIEASQLEGASLGFRFRHALTRDAVLAETLPHERAELAARAVDALEAAYPGLLDDWAELAARLAEDAGQHDRSAAIRLESARRAVARGDLASAEAALEWGRMHTRDEDLLAAIDEVLSDALALAGRVDSVVAIAPQLLSSLARIDAPPARRAEVHLRVARAAVAATRWRDADAAWEAASSLVSPDDRVLSAKIAVLAAEIAMGQGRPEDAVTAAQAALDVADHDAHPDTVCAALEVIGKASRFARPGEAEVAFERAWTTAERAGLTHWALRAQHELGTIDLIRHARVDRLARAREAAYAGGALSTAATLDLQLAAIHGLRFEGEEAVAAARRAADASDRFGFPAVRPVALLHEAFAHVVAGHGDHADRLTKEALALAGGEPNVAAGAWGHCRATASLLAERRDRARRQLDSGVQYLRQDPTVVWPFIGWWVLLGALADDSATRDEDWTDAYAGVRFVGALCRMADAVWRGRHGDLAGCDAAFEDADAELRALDHVDGFRHLARRLAAEAALQDGWGNPARWLGDALTFFDMTTHAKVATACRSLLRRAGAPVPRASRSGTTVPGPLASLGITVREFDVLQLLAERLSTAEIAERLYLSRRTVEKHVEHLMDKFGVRSRAALTALLDAGTDIVA